MESGFIRPASIKVRKGGWGTGIRTPVMSESESDALPLGDAPIFEQVILYHYKLGLSIVFCKKIKKILNFLFFEQKS